MTGKGRRKIGLSLSIVQHTLFCRYHSDRKREGERPREGAMDPLGFLSDK